MSKPEFLNQLSEILEVPAGSLTGSEKLADLDDWNSLAMISFMAFGESHFGKVLSARQLAACDTIDDLGKLAGVEDSPSA